MKELYICDYPYILYSALIKAMTEPEKEKDILITNSFLEMENLVEPIRKSGIFKNTYFYDDVLYRQDIRKIFIVNNYAITRTNFIKKCIFLFKGGMQILSAQYKVLSINLPVRLDVGYDQIYYSDRMSTLMFYLNKKKIPYSSLEHSKHIWEFKRKSEIKKMRFFYCLEKLHLSCGINCFTKACKEIFVDDKLVIGETPPQAKVTEWKIDKCISSLSESQKDILYKMYESAYALDLDYSQSYALLLTTPLLEDSIVLSEEAQITFYKDQVEKHFPGKPLIIKVHPRDNVDYANSFPGCVVIEKSLPSEILNMSKDLNLFGVLVLCSTSASSFLAKTDNLIILNKGDYYNIPLLAKYQM